MFSIDVDYVSWFLLDVFDLFLEKLLQSTHRLDSIQQRKSKDRTKNEKNTTYDLDNTLYGHVSLES
jgi:hypothetical protein